jgi:hypothetical protein
MRTLQYWKAVTNDRSDFLERLLAELENLGVEFCVVGDAAVNAYCEPVVTEDLDVAIAIRDLPRVEKAFAEQFEVRRLARSIEVSARDSGLLLHILSDERYEAFVPRARVRDVLGLRLPVAAQEDVLQGKIWAVQDEDRRPSKRQKDLADISRLIEAEPALRKRVPADVLARLFQ